MHEDPQDMFREMDELFTHIFTRITNDFARGDPQEYGYHMIIRHSGESTVMPFSQRDQLRAISEPVMEIHRIGDEVKVITELPGATMDAIELEFKGSTLTIHADGGSLQYHTHADLPRVDPGSMQSSFKNGVLEVTFEMVPDRSEKEGW